MRKTFLLLFLTITFLQCTTKHSSKIKVTKLIESQESWNGQTLPNYPTGTPKVSILKIEIPPHTATKIHKHPIINAGVLLKGQLTVITKKGDTLHLKEGDPIIEVVNTWHYGKNEINRKAVILVFYAGTTELPLSIIE